MASLIPNLPSQVSNATYFIAGVVLASLVAAKAIRRSDLDAIPTMGSSSWLGLWWASFKFSKYGANLLREGYAKYKGRPFKLAYRYHWLVIVSSREHLDELRRVPEDQISFNELLRERASGDYLIGKECLINPYHVSIVRSQLSHNIGTMCSEMRDEIVTAFDDLLDLKGDEWKSMPALDIVHKVVFRTNNRFFVGLPLCRDPDWVDFSIGYAVDIIMGAHFLQRFPRFLEPFLSPFIPNIAKATERGAKFIAPIIAERQKCLDKYGDKWVDKPNDFLSLAMDVTEGEDRTAERLARRVMFLNFASIHSMAQAFARALIYLAANPQYIQPLREEAEAIIEQEGWTKAALAKMHKMDSLFKETQRFNVTETGKFPQSLMRKAVVDYTFSDGMIIPKGTLISAPAGCMHLDEEIYENAGVFDPLRFFKMREAEGEGEKHQYVSTSLEYLSFGHGRHACAGRFFAVVIMKATLAHILLSYDIKLEDNLNVTDPEVIRIGTAVSVDPNMKMMFRRRN